MKTILSKTDLSLLSITFIFLFLSLATLIFMIFIYDKILPIILLIIFFLISFSNIFIFAFIKCKELNKTLVDLDSAKFHNNSLQALYDNMRTFRHDFFNIMQSIDGYIKTHDVSSLEKYYSEIKSECNSLNNLSTLDPDIIDDAGIYNLISSKYFNVQEYNINLDMHFLVKFSKLNVSFYALSRILGILLDNAIEAAKLSDDKSITFDILPTPGSNSVSIIIENSYNNKDIDLQRIYEKGFSSKTENSRFSWSWFMES